MLSTRIISCACNSNATNNDLIGSDAEMESSRTLDEEKEPSFPLTQPDRVCKERLTNPGKIMLLENQLREQIYDLSAQISQELWLGPTRNEQACLDALEELRTKIFSVIKSYSDSADFNSLTDEEQNNFSARLMWYYSEAGAELEAALLALIKNMKIATTLDTKIDANTLNIMMIILGFIRRLELNQKHGFYSFLHKRCLDALIERLHVRRDILIRIFNIMIKPLQPSELAHGESIKSIKEQFFTTCYTRLQEADEDIEILTDLLNEEYEASAASYDDTAEDIYLSQQGSII